MANELAPIVNNFADALNSVLSLDVGVAEVLVAAGFLYGGYYLLGRLS